MPRPEHGHPHRGEAPTHPGNHHPGNRWEDAADVGEPDASGPDAAVADPHGGTAPRPAGAFAATDDEPDVAVRIRGLAVSYGPIHAVRDVDLELRRGSTVAIIGPNGSGKSTLLGTISGLVRPTRGTVEVLATADRSARHAVAHVLQTTVTNDALPITVRETVRMGTYGHRGLLGRLTPADRAAIDEAVDRMRIGDLLGRQLNELSGGQRQRVYVAQGLAQRAPVLLLDEPITGLDLVTQETITEVIDQERATGHTIVLTTHDVGTARLADVAVLMATSPVAIGPPATALTPSTLGTAYGGHVHVLDDGTIVLDEPHHHDHRFDDQLGG